MALFALMLGSTTSPSEAELARDMMRSCVASILVRTERIGFWASACFLLRRKWSASVTDCVPERSARPTCPAEAGSGRQGSTQEEETGATAPGEVVWWREKGAHVGVVSRRRSSRYAGKVQTVKSGLALGGVRHVHMVSRTDREEWYPPFYT